MIRKEIREQGVVGTLFLNPKSSTTVIILGGSSGGLKEERAESLAKEGMNALALAYFGVESLPKDLKEIPLEYFETAIEIASRFSEKIGLWGVSRGAELSLLLGTLFPKKIHVIAAHVPSSVVFGALNGQDLPAWLYRGKPIQPSAPFQYSSEAMGEREEDAIRATPSFLRSMLAKEAFEKAAICVEKIECPLFLISAEDDQMWPSSLFAKQIVERLKERGSNIEVTHLSYRGVGHAPSKGTFGFHPVMKRWFAYGGCPEENARAAIEWTQKTILFFKKI